MIEIRQCVQEGVLARLLASKLTKVVLSPRTYKTVF